MEKFGFKYSTYKKTNGFAPISESMLKVSKNKRRKFTTVSGEQYTFKFNNGYGASVIKTPYVSYGWENDKWEIAVLDSSGDITYDTPITTDVIGYLDEDGVHQILEQIQKLPKE